MIVERGIVTRTLSMRLILQSNDVETHAFISDYPEIFNRILLKTQETFIRELKAEIGEDR